MLPLFQTSSKSVTHFLNLYPLYLFLFLFLFLTDLYPHFLFEMKLLSWLLKRKTKVLIQKPWVYFISFGLRYQLFLDKPWSFGNQLLKCRINHCLRKSVDLNWSIVLWQSWWSSKFSDFEKTWMYLHHISALTIRLGSKSIMDIDFTILDEFLTCFTRYKKIKQPCYLLMFLFNFFY